MKPIYEGGCLCGVVRYRFEDDPRVVSHCHCTVCRRVSGAPYVTWLTVRRDRIEVEGDIEWFTSSEWGARGFCPRCGTHIVGRSEHYERYWDITAGSLDAPDRISPDRHVFAENKVAWIAINDGLPVHAGEATSPPPPTRV
ncbi:MAG: GFA family protein [Pseudomonadota bacterium]